MNTRNAFGSKPNSVAPVSISDAKHDTEATLRLIANLPSPEGLENRVIAGLRSAPRSSSVFSWPGVLNPADSWLRTAAAAAIVFVIVGGGWGVYSRVQPNNAIAAPPGAGAAAGFSNAGALRVPQTLPAPVATRPTPVRATQPQGAEPEKKPHGKIAVGTHLETKHAATNKDSLQTSVPSEK
jgi:hypothetical protein